MYKKQGATTILQFFKGLKLKTESSVYKNGSTL